MPVRRISDVRPQTFPGPRPTRSLLVESGRVCAAGNWMTRKRLAACCCSLLWKGASDGPLLLRRRARRSPQIYMGNSLAISLSVFAIQSICVPDQGSSQGNHPSLLFSTQSRPAGRGTLNETPRPVLSSWRGFDGNVEFITHKRTPEWCAPRIFVHVPSRSTTCRYRPCRLVGRRVAMQSG